MTDVVAGLLLRDGKALLGLRKAGGKRGGLWEMPGGTTPETVRWG
jgi:8-oxo-dGTP pyrophosphatase MutT (NUDIX family)